jgi:hypothetical protein
MILRISLACAPQRHLNSSRNSGFGNSTLKQFMILTPQRGTEKTRDVVQNARTLALQ